MARFRPTPDDIAHATKLRHALHRAPELSGQEHRTAATIAAEMRAAGADDVLTGLGGTGVAAVFSRGPGPAVMIRAELDALPIPEENDLPYASQTPGVAHLCGHDGHMATLVALARALGRERPISGRAILLFQPAEEDGEGAAAVLSDPRTATLAPDLVVSLHNLPGLPLGHVALNDGPMGCASRGMKIALTGRPAHASQPETGRSPCSALARLMVELPALASNAAFPDPDFALVTVARVSMGARAFGVAPGAGEIWVTLRSLQDERMARLIAAAETSAATAAQEAGLDHRITWHEVFEVSHNDPAAVGALRGALDACDIPHSADGQPWRPSEDFGRLGALAPAAMLFLGSGESQAPLHDPRFDYPDALIETGAAIFAELLAQQLEP